MSSMYTPATSADLFAVVRRGYDREQVTEMIVRLEAESELLRADRDAAVERAERAFEEAAQERARVAVLESRVAELGRAPVTSGQMSDRLSTMLSLATAEAESIRDAALVTADRIRAEAEDEAWRTREAATSELAEARARADAIRREHSAVLAAASSRADEIALAARRESERLDHEAARKRAQIDEDHRLASDVRRTDSLREIESRNSAALKAAETIRAEAEADARRREHESRAEAERMIASARSYTAELLTVRERVLGELASIRARLESIPGRVDHEEQMPPQPDLSSSGE